jgi:hypothetical protein
MRSDEHARLFMAPELIVVDVAGAAIAALERALLVAHPLLTDGPSTEDPDIRRRAHSVLRLARRLDCALDAYRDTAEEILAEMAESDDVLF